MFVVSLHKASEGIMSDIYIVDVSTIPLGKKVAFIRDIQKVIGLSLPESKDIAEGVVPFKINNNQKDWSFLSNKYRVSLKNVSPYEAKEIQAKNLTDKFSYHWGKINDIIQQLSEL